MKLVQRHPLKGTQSFEIVEDRVEVCIKPLFKKEENLTVMLTVLNPEPVIQRTCLDFVSRVNGDALITLALGKPHAKEFNAFVSLLKQKAEAEYRAFLGLGSRGSASPPNRAVLEAGGIAANVFEEPPEFPELDAPKPPNPPPRIHPARIEESLEMLERHLDTTDLQALIAALQALQAEPGNAACFQELVSTFNRLGMKQGAVLTYAPYLGVLLSDDPFGEA